MVGRSSCGEEQVCSDCLRKATPERDIDGGFIVPGPIPATRKAAQPGTRIELFGVECRICIGVGGLATLEAGVRCACGVLPGLVRKARGCAPRTSFSSTRSLAAGLPASSGMAPVSVLPQEIDRAWLSQPPDASCVASLSENHRLCHTSVFTQKTERLPHLMLFQMQHGRKALQRARNAPMGDQRVAQHSPISSLAQQTCALSEARIREVTGLTPALLLLSSSVSVSS
jgi:hypothetical protein